MRKKYLGTYSNSALYFLLTRLTFCKMFFGQNIVFLYFTAWRSSTDWEKVQSYKADVFQLKRIWGKKYLWRSKYKYMYFSFLISIHLSFSRDIFDIFRASRGSENREVPVTFGAWHPQGWQAWPHALKVRKFKKHLP